MQSRPSIEQPRFTSLSAFALRLVQAYTSWRDVRTREDVFAYFQHRPQHTGDEHNLRATLIREHILPAFDYTPLQIEYESQERFDLVLWSQKHHRRRKIAIIETKSSSQRNLVVLQRRSETPVEQLERYLSQAGLYLGVVTNGDEWHLLDFAVAREPLASFSLVELATLLPGAPTQEMAEQLLAGQPLLRQALAVTLYYLDARRWEQTDVFRDQLANLSYHHVASLQTSQQIETLVQQIKQVLGSLRETIHAQFTLLHQRYDDYQQRRTLTSEQDQRPFEECLHSAIKQVGEFDTAFRLHEESQLRAEITTLLSELARQFLQDGNISVFESEYLQQVQTLLTRYQLEQASLLEGNTQRSVRLLPPSSGLDDLKLLLQTHFAYLQTLDEEYDLSKRTVEAYLTWQSNVRGVFRNPQDEFCLQTAYIHFVRIFFVRVCEDHGLIPRRISDGPFARFEVYRQELLIGIKDTYLRLLEETYQRARSVYHNFFGHKELYEWFTLDEYSILAIFDLLNRYNFRGISADVLGQVYNEGYIEAKDRSERGQFYTPPQVVGYMLDVLGIPNTSDPEDQAARDFLEKSVGDLSCGSGTFLVAAAARKSALLQRLISEGEIQPGYALQLITETLLGFDLNPFACYLAGINLLIQCLPLLLGNEGKLSRSVERFHIYCTDTLEPAVAEQVRALIEHTATKYLTLPSSQSRKRMLSDDERAVLSIKDMKRLPSALSQSGIDYLVGNPPYVSAGESSENLDYRNQVVNFGTYHFLHQRWDLFIPFFERNLQFLHPDTGCLALIVSRGIETEGYAEKLRQHLTSQCRILQIDFFPRLRLFQDAAVENTIVFVENRPPNETDQVVRRQHQRPDCKQFQTLPPVQQLEAQEHLFRWSYDPTLDQQLTTGSIPLCAIVYIGTGVEAQSKETFDPIVNGRRQKLFTLDQVFLPPSSTASRPTEYPDEGVLGDDVDRYHLRRKRYVAYDTYRPNMRRPRHVALFRTPEKLLLGETSGGYYDRSSLFANHSVQVVVPWHALEQAGASEEAGIKKVLRESRQIAGIQESLAPVAKLFDLCYLLGIINSQFIRHYIAANRLEGTREGRIYPDVWKRLPIKVASNERQQEVATLVDQIQALYQQLVGLSTPADLVGGQIRQFRNIQGFLVSRRLRFSGNVQSAIATNPAIRDGRLILRRQPLTYLEAPDAPDLLRYVELYLTQLHPELQGHTWEQVRLRIQAPPTLDTVRMLMASIDDLHFQKAHIRTTIETLLAQVETLIETIYHEPADSDKMEIIRQLREHKNNHELF